MPVHNRVAHLASIPDSNRDRRGKSLSCEARMNTAVNKQFMSPV